MAKLSFEGMDSLIKALHDADLFTEDVQQELLSAGEAHVSDLIRQEISRDPYNLSFVDKKLTRNRKIEKDKNGDYYLYVSVTGKNDRGERNAAVAFVLNYGRREKFGKIEGSYFWTSAVQRSSNSLLPVYEKVITEKYREKGLI